MRILDRYVIRKFLGVLFYATLAFIAIFIVIDLVEHLDKILSSKAELPDVVLYYTYYIPFIILLALPMSMLLSSLLSIGMMAQNNEIISTLTAGISLYRLIAPLLVLGMIISIVSGYAGETVVTASNRLRLDIWRYNILKEPRAIVGTRRQVAVQDIGNRQVSIQYYDGKRRRANQVNIVRIENNRVVERWDLRYMEWDEKRRGWKMYNVFYRQFTDTGETVARYDTLWYDETKIYPDDLLELQVKPEEMNYRELRRFVDNMVALGADARRWLVDLYMKISYPFSNFIIVLLGAPLAARKRRSGPAVGFALALLICFVYFIFLRSGQVLGHNGTLNPWLGAWSGNIFFGICGLIALWRVRQ
ncbi:MAG: YjgP/YjgQ family permease [Calditrichaeota bacterium]|nr:MAG: YjgP/YjgQ family permease [Calditrichota bacterium]